VLLHELVEHRFRAEAGGRLSKWFTRDAQIAFENFDMEGRPRRTRQVRYANGSGFTAKEVITEHVQEHEWNVHGERTAWTMPLPQAFAVPGWTTRVEEDHDAMGNVTAIRRALTGSIALLPLMTADYRNAGRPNSRSITTVAGQPIVRAYGYDASTAQLDDLVVSARNLIVAGSRIDYDGVQIARATLHGVSSDTRANEYGYDDRSRLAQSRAARTSGAVDKATEHVDSADFRTALERVESGPAALPSLGFARQTGHKIAHVVRGGETRTFLYGGGAERVDDGKFVYEFDARGRLITATEKVPTNARRVRYYYAVLAPGLPPRRQERVCIVWPHFARGTVSIL
jgi:hypothetical protein